MKKTALLSLIIASVFLFGACGKNTQPPKERKEKTELKNPKKIFAYIKSVSKTGENFIAAIDEIQYFTGETAKKEFLKDNRGKTGEGVTNGYYIRNKDTKTREVKLSPDVKIIMQTFSYDEYGNFKKNEQINIARFSELFSGYADKRYSQIPFEVHIAGAGVRLIKEIYIP